MGYSRPAGGCSNQEQQCLRLQITLLPCFLALEVNVSHGGIGANVLSMSE